MAPFFCQRPDDFLFWDGIHPTTAGQALIAQFVESMIDGPHQYSMMAESLLRTREGHLRTLNDGLMLARNRPEGERWNVFAAIDHGVFEVDNEPGVQGLRNSANSGSVGITTNLSEAVTLGIAAGQTKSRNSFMRGTGNYNSNEKILSLFGSVRMGGQLSAAQLTAKWMRASRKPSRIRWCSTSSSDSVPPLVRTCGFLKTLSRTMGSVTRTVSIPLLVERFPMSSTSSPHACASRRARRRSGGGRSPTRTCCSRT